MTVKQLFEDHWLPAQQSRDLRPATLVQYRNVLSAWIVPYLGGKKVFALTPMEVTKLDREAENDKVSAWEVRTFVAISAVDGWRLKGCLRLGCAKWLA